MKERSNLKNEAVKVNGQYIEDLIEGYTTLTTSGRDVPVKEISVVDSSIDGNIKKESRIASKTITVEYLLEADNQLDFVEKYNQLVKYLNVEDAQIIFNDEPDKYYIGSIVFESEIEETVYFRNGQFRIECYDPFKHAVNETLVIPSRISEEGESYLAFTTVNNGNYKTPPRFEVQFAEDTDADGNTGNKADCGFVYFQRDDKSIQFGDDLEKDTHSQVVVNTAFDKAKLGNWDYSVIAIDSSHILKNSGINAFAGYGLNASAYGKESGKYHGPSGAFIIPTAVAGDFTFEWKNIIALTSNAKNAKKQCGCFQVRLLDSSNNLVCGFGIEKKTTASTNGTAYFYNGSEKVSKTKINLAYTGKFGYKKKGSTAKRLTTNKITRKDDTITIKTAVGSQTFNNVNVTAVKKIQIYFGKYSTKAEFEDNYCYCAKFTDGDYDFINSFTSNDLLEVDTSDYSVMLNNTPAANLGDIGNDWDDMKLEPGENIVYVAYSDWVQAGYEPTFKMYYRKRWL